MVLSLSVLLLLSQLRIFQKKSSSMSADRTGRANAPPVEAHGPDVLRVLICTDTHIGCHERNPVRKDDSINAFRECLQLAKKVSALLSFFLFMRRDLDSPSYIMRVRTH